MKKYYIKVNIKKDKNVISESLTRIGIINRLKNELYQSCHLIEKNNEFHLVHFKELFSIFKFMNADKIEKNVIFMSDADFERRNTVIFLLKKWDLIDYNEDLNIYINENKGHQKLTVVPHQEKHNYTFVSKFKL